MVKCDFLQSQTSTPVGRFQKPGWHKLHQQHMSTLNVNRNIQTVLLGDSLVQGLSRLQRYGIHFSGRTHYIVVYGETKSKTYYGERKNQNVHPLSDKQLFTAGPITLKKTRQMMSQMVYHVLLKRNSVTNVYITRLLPREFRETHKRNKIKKVNKLIREKCSSISTPRIKHIE